MQMSVGNFDVVTTEQKGHGIEFYAERMVARMISVAETAPEPIRQQALIYRDQLYQIVLDGLKRAVLSDRLTLQHAMKRHGLDEAATLISVTEA